MTKNAVVAAGLPVPWARRDQTNRAQGSQLPIVEQVCEVVTAGCSAVDAVSALVTHPTGSERWP